MIFEKNKIYKIQHSMLNKCIGWRDYIIFSPIKDIDVQIPCYKSFEIESNFVICFDKTIVTKYDKDCKTGFDWNCAVKDLDNKDLNEVRLAMMKLGHGYKYNRKLSKLVYGT